MIACPILAKTMSTHVMIRDELEPSVLLAAMRLKMTLY